MRERILYVICIMVFAMGCFYYRIQLHHVTSDYGIAKTENARLAQSIENESFNMETARREIAILKNKNYLKCILTPSDVNVSALEASVYQAKEGGQVFVIVTKPFPIPRDQQYQLWGIKGGQYINAGNFQVGLTGLQKTLTLPLMDSFTITIEPMGKSVKPSTGQIVVTEIL